LTRPVRITIARGASWRATANNLFSTIRNTQAGLRIMPILLEAVAVSTRRRLTSPGSNTGSSFKS
jgi:hypothetical protein